IGRVGSKLVAPPEFRSRAAARGVLPFGFTRKPELLLRDLREPPRELLRVGPAYVGHRGVILAGRLIGACFRRHARFPFPHGDRKFADREGLYGDAVDRLLGKVVVAAHRERAPRKRNHFWDRRSCGRRRWTGFRGLRRRRSRRRDRRRWRRRSRSRLLR